MTDTRPDVAVEEVAETNGNRRLLWALVLISVAQLMVVLDGTIVNIALPYIQTTSTSRSTTSAGSSPATRWPSAACCSSAGGSVTSTAAARSS